MRKDKNCLKIRFSVFGSSNVEVQAASMLCLGEFADYISVSFESYKGSITEYKNNKQGCSSDFNSSVI